MTDSEFAKCIEMSVSGTVTDRDGAWHVILPKIQQAARITRMKSPEEAPGIIFERLQAKKFASETTEGIVCRFTAWCITILKHHEIDESRKRARRREISVEINPERLNSIDAEIMAFLPEDLRLLGQWSAQVRVRMLLMSGLWHLLPRSQWEQDLAELGIDPSLSAKVDLCNDRKERVKVIANELGVPANTLHQTWARKAPLLKKLSFIEEAIEQLCLQQNENDHET